MYASYSLMLHLMQAVLVLVLVLAFVLPVAVVESRSVCLKRVVQDR